MLGAGFVTSQYFQSISSVANFRRLTFSQLEPTLDVLTKAGIPVTVGTNAPPTAAYEVLRKI